MDENEKKALTELYENRLNKYGRDVKTVGWRSRPQQIARFEALVKIADLHNKTLLDIGCGFGELYDFLISKEVKLKYYKGFDLSAKLVEKAIQIHSKVNNVEFEVLDILKENNLDEKYDFVIASGIFSFPIKDNQVHLYEMLKKMYEICKLGVAVNMPTSYVDFKEKNLYYFVPETVFGFCKNITKRVSLIHDYMPYEFTIYLYKDQTIDEDHVFSEFRINSKIDRTMKKINFS